MWLNWLTDSIREFIHRGDRLLLTLCLLASGFGMVLIYSATRYMNHSAGLRCMLIQAVGIVLGVFVYIAMSSVDIELFTEKSWKWLFLFGLFINLLLLTPLGIGADETGNNSWLSIPGFPVNLQPAELAKLTFVLLLAWQMNRQRERGLSRPSSVFQLAGHTLVMIGLIVATSGDFGMALTYAFIFVIMAWAGGVKTVVPAGHCGLCHRGRAHLAPHQRQVLRPAYHRGHRSYYGQYGDHQRTDSGTGLSADPQHPGYRQRGAVRHGVSQGDSDPEPL